MPSKCTVGTKCYVLDLSEPIRLEPHTFRAYAWSCKVLFLSLHPPENTWLDLDTSNTSIKVTHFINCDQISSCFTGSQLITR